MGVVSIALAVLLIGLIMSVVIHLVLGIDTVEISVALDRFVMAIIVFCLIQFFAYGAELEKDANGG